MSDTDVYWTPWVIPEADRTEVKANNNKMAGDGEGCYTQAMINGMVTEATMYESRQDALEAKARRKAEMNPPTKGAIEAKAKAKAKAKEVFKERVRAIEKAIVRCRQSLEAGEVPIKEDFDIASSRDSLGVDFWQAVSKVCESRLGYIREKVPEMELTSLTGYYITGVYDKTQAKVETKLPGVENECVFDTVEVLAEAMEEISHHADRYGLPEQIGKVVFAKLNATCSNEKWEKVKRAFLTTEEKQKLTALRKAAEKATRPKTQETVAYCDALSRPKPKRKGKGRR